MSMIEPVRKSIVVKRNQADAFRLFTEGMGTWWPLRSHSVFDDNAETCIMDGRVGGRIIERSKTGEESVWGRILAWEPPDRVLFTFHPGRAEGMQQVEVRFIEAGSCTRVELVHTGWEELGERGAEARREYHGGWEV